MAERPQSKFVEATRAHTEEARARIDAMRAGPSPSTPPVRLAGDVVVSTSEEELTQLIAECRGSPEKTQYALDFIEKSLREGELKFVHSRTRATKVVR